MNEKPLDFIPLDCRLRQNPKVRKLCRLLGEKHGHVYFINLLLDTGINCPDGTLKDIDADLLADICDYDGEPKKLLGSMKKAGLIDVKRGQKLHQVCIKNWETFGGRVLKSRAYHRNRRKIKTLERENEVCAKLRELGGDVSEKDYNITEQNPTKPNQTKAEKLRSAKGVLDFKEGEKDTAMEVYSHWSKYHPYATHQPSDTTLSYVVRNLRLGRSVDQLTRCVDGYHHDKFLKDNPSCQKLSWMLLNDERVVSGLERRDKQKPSSKNRLSSEQEAEISEIYELLIEYGTEVRRGDVALVMSKSTDQDKIRDILRALPMEQRKGCIVAEVLDA